MTERIKQFLKLNNLNIDKPIVCAVSGGADSLALIQILYELGYKVILAHVNHHKRLESEEEAIAMEAYARSLNIPFEILNYHYSGNGNFHDESHNARYEFFRNVAKKYNTNIIATAHHAKDQLETILIKMMEGSNLYGYGGMPVSYDDGEFIVIRPILLLTKEEICNFLNERNIKWYEDSSNYQDEFLRNRLRHHVIPLLEKECPDLYNKVIQYSSLLHESFDYIRDDSKKYLNDNDNMINIDTFKDLRIALKKDIISLMLEGYTIQKNNAIIEDVLELASSDKGSKDISLKDGYYFIKEYNLLYISKKDEKNIESVSLSLDDVVIFGNKYKFYFSKIIPNNNAKYIKLCYNQLELPLLIRNRNDGDFIALNNGNKKVSRVLIDRKVPKYKRGEVPIVVDNLGNILWIYNYLKSDIVYKQKGNSDIYLVCEVL